MAGKKGNSLETILTYENRDMSQWSVQWSTSQVPEMDNASGRARGRAAGRRRLRLGALGLAGLLAMHCRVAAAALTGGLFVFMAFLIASVAVLANPMRHFEVYLGQWSISGPGRAFRIIPMFDGIGIAICINAIVRSIICCYMGAIALLYVVNAVADSDLPFTYCRDFNLMTYKPVVKDMRRMIPLQSRFYMETGLEGDFKNVNNSADFYYNSRSKTGSKNKNRLMKKSLALDSKSQQIAVCRETYNGTYPVVYDTPEYNYFYVELVHLRDDHELGHFNLTVLMSDIVLWCVIWALMVSERFRYGKLVWNNVCIWLVVIPFVWSALLSVTAISSLVILKKSVRKVFRMGAKELIAAIADGLEVSLYVHAASVGTEIVHGKGLNHYASGHIDPHLHAENVWHSVLLLLITFLHCVGAALCALVDSSHFTKNASMAESTLWVMPMYSKCSSFGNYSHFMTTLIFGGLAFSYVSVAFILLKTALHIIFEYKVKLVFVEQIVVAALIFTCMGLSLPLASNGGIALLESVDALMSGVGVAFVCLLELIGILYVYRAHDFVSDMNLSMEDSACSSRIRMSWRMIPVTTLITLFLKGLTLAEAELPAVSLYLGLAPLAGVVCAVPLRAAHNAFVFMHPAPRRGTS